ncbi:MAG: hypothetical protein A2X18_09955 [Bacteroidetes bacterium GWF2_40_14]|nr:MAG: hypothetical protein A2X18_09955 [Bacteroidetes bacterium GWF2_40_14]
MDKKTKTAPFFDYLIRVAQSQTIVTDKDCIEKLLLLINEISVLEIQGVDELRNIWIEVPRGDIQDYGLYEEFLEGEVVSNYEEFVEMWKYEYPEITKWYEISVATYNKEYYFYVDSVLTFHVKFLEERPTQAYYSGELIGWFFDVVMDVMSFVKTDIAKYNEHINNYLPFDRRFGKILRKDYWSIFPEEGLTFQNQLSEEDVNILETIVNQSVDPGIDLVLKKLTAGDFFDYCRIGYVANDYFTNDTNNLTALEMYKRSADGRDEGFTKLNLDSEADFLDWFRNKNGGGHPWEICRGGNSTHISLYVQSSENGWLLVLDGSSCVRVLETVKMAIALYKSHIPFILNKSAEILRMITGIDYIGIVPKTIFPRYCNSHFPPEDKIIDFMNLGFDNKEEIIQKATWYPLRRILL